LFVSWAQAGAAKKINDKIETKTKRILFI